MKSLTQQQASHKQWLLRLLGEIADDLVVSQEIAFKGESCAALLGYLDRFSVDLDFDLLSLGDESKNSIRGRLRDIFDNIGLLVDQESKTQLQFFLKYKALPNERNTLKLEIIDSFVKANEYQVVYIQEIDRYMQTQTIETMFANKLVAFLDRYEKHGSIAVRDVYDINYFFNQGYSYNREIIKERMRVPVKMYLSRLIEFIEKYITQRRIIEDLNYLLDARQLRVAKSHLKIEVINNIKTAMANE